MKGTLTFMINSYARTLEEIREHFEGCEVKEHETHSFCIEVPLEIDPDNPYKAMEEYQSETGEDCFEVFTIKLEDGQTFTEEEYED